MCGSVRLNTPFRLLPCTFHERSQEGSIPSLPSRPGQNHQDLSRQLRVETANSWAKESRLKSPQATDPAGLMLMAPSSSVRRSFEVSISCLARSVGWFPTNAWGPHPCNVYAGLFLSSYSLSFPHTHRLPHYFATPFRTLDYERYAP